MDRTQEFLKELVETDGTSGFEGAVFGVMAKHLEGVGTISRDRLGSFICEKKGAAGPKVMLAGHLDEVGFMVKSVSKEGFVRFLPLGGWWGHVVLAQQLVIKTRKGDVLGVVGSKPPHDLRDEDRKKVLEIKDMYIDVGATSDWDVRKRLDIRPGDPIVPAGANFTLMANRNVMLAKAWDNRLGCALAAETARALKGASHPNTLYAVATVQEEVGLRGAQTSAFKVQPDVAVALDVGIAHDTPGAEGDEKLGGGPLIVIYDATAIPNRKLLDLVVDTARGLKIPLQFESVERGGTDAGRIHMTGEGVPTISMGCAARYIHSHVSMIDRRDFDQTVRLLVGLVKKLDRKTVARLTG